MLTRRSVAALRQGLDAGAFTPTDLMAETLDHIATTNPALNAIVSLRDRADLLAEAASPKPGLLSGIPIAIKDLTATSGLRTTYGSRNFAENIPDTDDRLAARLKAAGAIVVGKTNTPEFGIGSQTFNAVFGRTLNPYDTSKTCGGSSGGASVAVASGMLPVADGSDMMGSLRNPAAWANIYGLRPSVGLVPPDPGAAMALPLSTGGAMARHPGDLARMLQVLGAPAPGWPLTPVLDVPDLSLSHARIGWIGDCSGLPFEGGILEGSRGALGQMEAAGATVTDLTANPFDRDAAWDAWTTLRSQSIARANRVAFEDPTRRDRLKDTAIWEIERGLSLSFDALQRAEVLRSAVIADMDKALTSFDVLALPATQVWPFDVQTEYPTVIDGTMMDTYHRWMEVMLAASLTGLPAICLPIGFSESSLPIGLTLIGRRGSDLTLIRLAEDWQDMTNWPGVRPPVFA